MSFEHYVKSFARGVEVLSEGGKDVFVHVISFVSLICAPAPPALTFGYALYLFAITRMGEGIAIAIGGALALTLEGAGLQGARVALASYHEWDEGRSGPEKTIVAVAVNIVYMLTGVITVILFDPDPKFRIMGILAFVIAALLYVVNALQSGDKRRDERTENERRDNIDLKKYEIAQRTEIAKEKVRVSSEVTTHRVFEQQKRDAVLKRQAKRQEFLQYLRDNPYALNNVSELVRKVNASRPSVDTWIREYTSNGTIVVATNGDGQKVVEVR
jgi:hypothetical protein